MAFYVVAVDWACNGRIRVDANSLEEAIAKVETNIDAPLPDGDYIDNSFRVNREVTELLLKVRDI